MSPCMESVVVCVSLSVCARDVRASLSCPCLCLRVRERKLQSLCVGIELISGRGLCAMAHATASPAGGGTETGDYASATTTSHLIIPHQSNPGSAPLRGMPSRSSTNATSPATFCVAHHTMLYMNLGCRELCSLTCSCYAAALCTSASTTRSLSSALVACGSALLRSMPSISHTILHLANSSVRPALTGTDLCSAAAAAYTRPHSSSFHLNDAQLCGTRHHCQRLC